MQDPGEGRLRLHGHLHPGVHAQDPGPWHGAPPWVLPQGLLELHGHHRRLVRADILLPHSGVNKLKNKSFVNDENISPPVQWHPHGSEAQVAQAAPGAAAAEDNQPGLTHTHTILRKK